MSQQKERMQKPQSSDSLRDTDSNLSLEAEMDKESRLTFEDVDSEESLVKQAGWGVKRQVDLQGTQVATPGSLLMDVVKQEVNTTRLQVRRVPAHHSKLCFLTEQTTEKRTKMVVSPRTGRNLQRDSLVRSFIPPEMHDVLARQQLESSLQSDNKRNRKKRKNRRRKRKEAKKMEAKIVDYRSNVQQRPNCLANFKTSLPDQSAESSGKVVRLSATRLELPQPSRSELRFKAHKVDFQMASVVELVVKLSPRGQSTMSSQIESISKSPNKSLLVKSTPIDQRATIKAKPIKQKEEDKGGKTAKFDRDESSILLALPDELLEHMQDYIREKTNVKVESSGQPNTQNSSSSYVKAISMPSSKLLMESEESSILFINPLLVQSNDTEVTDKSSGIIYTIPRDDSSIVFSNPKLMISPKAKLQKSPLVSRLDTKLFEKIKSPKSNMLKLTKSSACVESLVPDDSSIIISNPYLIKSPSIMLDVDTSRSNLPTPRSRPRIRESSKISTQSKSTLTPPEEMESKVTIGKPSQYSLVVDLIDDDSSIKLSNPKLMESPSLKKQKRLFSSSKSSKYLTLVDVPSVLSGNRLHTSQKSANALCKADDDGNISTQQVVPDHVSEKDLNSNSETVDSRVLALSKSASYMILDSLDSSPSKTADKPREDKVCVQSSIPRQMSAEPVVRPFETEVPSQEYIMGKCSSMDLRRASSQLERLTPEEINLINKALLKAGKSAPVVEHKGSHCATSTHENKPPSDFKGKAISPVGSSGKLAELEASDGSVHGVTADALPSLVPHSHDVPSIHQLDKSLFSSPIQLKTTSPKSTVLATNADSGPSIVTIGTSDKSIPQPVQAQIPEESSRQKHSNKVLIQSSDVKIVPVIQTIDAPFEPTVSKHETNVKPIFKSEVNFQTALPRELFTSETSLLSMNSQPILSASTSSQLLGNLMSQDDSSIVISNPTLMSSPKVSNSNLGREESINSSSQFKLESEPDLISTSGQLASGERIPSKQSTSQTESQTSLPSGSSTSRAIISNISFIQDDSSLIISNPMLMLSPSASSLHLIPSLQSNLEKNNTMMDLMLKKEPEPESFKLAKDVPIEAITKKPQSIPRDDSSVIISNPCLMASPKARVSTGSSTRSAKSFAVSENDHSSQANLIEGDKNLLLDNEKEPKSFKSTNEILVKEVKNSNHMSPRDTSSVVISNPLLLASPKPMVRSVASGQTVSKYKDVEKPRSIDNRVQTSSTTFHQEMCRFSLFQANFVKTLNKIDQDQVPIDLNKHLEPTAEESKAYAENLTPDGLIKQNQLLMEQEKNYLAKKCGKGKDEQQGQQGSVGESPRNGWVNPQVMMTLGGIAGAVAAMRLMPFGGGGNNNAG